MLSAKSIKFNKVLISAKHALDSIGIPFHLHSGTALGSQREHDFIKHDYDIDLAVFYSDVNTSSQVNSIIRAMKRYGFELNHSLGRLSSGKEISFIKNNVPLDIFWIYEINYRGTKYYSYSTYFDKCDLLPHKQCVWVYRLIPPVRINFLGNTYNTLSIKNIADIYGSDWQTPKKQSYTEGLNGGFKGLLKDYYNNRSTDTIAFCFLLQSNLKHKLVWEKFFKGDDYPVKSYNIYSYFESPNKNTPDWIKKSAVASVANTKEHDLKATIKMLKKALEIPTNKYFVLLCEHCIPIYNYETFYKKLFSSKKSRISVNDKWMILNRYTAKLLVNLFNTRTGKNYLKYIRSLKLTGNPLEEYPISWFKYKLTTQQYQSNIKSVLNTFIVDSNILEKKGLRKYSNIIYDTSALFAMKFKEDSDKLLRIFNI
jgi:predicted nucleic-acid-binding Zn-ribbon protein